MWQLGASKGVQHIKILLQSYPKLIQAIPENVHYGGFKQMLPYLRTTTLLLTIPRLANSCDMLAKQVVPLDAAKERMWPNVVSTSRSSTKSLRRIESQ